MIVKRQVNLLQNTLSQLKKPVTDTTGTGWRQETKISLKDSKSLVQFRNRQLIVTPRKTKPNVIEVDLQFEYLKHRRINLSFDLLPEIRVAGDSWFRQLFGGPLDFEIQQSNAELSQTTIPVKKKVLKTSNEEISGFSQNLRVEFQSKKEMGCWFQVKDLVDKMVEFQESQSMLLDIKLQQKVATDIFLVSKIFALYLKQVPQDDLTPEQQQSQAFLRAFMFDQIVKSNHLLLQELWKSRDMLNNERKKRFTRELQEEKDRCVLVATTKDLCLEDMKSQLMKKIAQLNSELESVRREGEVVRGELDDLKFQMHGLTNTYRRDTVLNKLKMDVREVESLMNDCEKERAKQQEAIFSVMEIINVSGGMIPKQANAATQTEVSSACQFSTFFTEAQEKSFSLQVTSQLQKLATLKVVESPAAKPAVQAKAQHGRSIKIVEQVKKPVTADEVYSFFSRVFAEKHKRDLQDKKTLGFAISLDEFTTLQLFEQNLTLAKAKETFLVYMMILQQSLSNPVTQVICQVYGWCGYRGLQKDFCEYLLQIIDAVGGSFFQSKSVGEFIQIQKKFFKNQNFCATIIDCFHQQNLAYSQVECYYVQPIVVNLCREPAVSFDDLVLQANSHQFKKLDFNRITFDLLSILIQLSSLKQKPTLRQLFATLVQGTTVTHSQLVQELFKDKEQEQENEAIIFFSSNQIQTLIDLMEPGEVTDQQNLAKKTYDFEPLLKIVEKPIFATLLKQRFGQVQFLLSVISGYQNYIQEVKSHLKIAATDSKAKAVEYDNFELFLQQAHRVKKSMDKVRIASLFVSCNSLRSLGVQEPFADCFMDTISNTQCMVATFLDRSRPKKR